MLSKCNIIDKRGSRLYDERSFKKPMMYNKANSYMTTIGNLLLKLDVNERGQLKILSNGMQCDILILPLSSFLSIV